MADHNDRHKPTRPFRQDAHHPPILPNQCLYCARWSVLLTTANNSRATRAVSNSFVSVAHNHNRQSTMTLVSCWSSLLHPTCYSVRSCPYTQSRAPTQRPSSRSGCRSSPCKSWAPSGLKNLQPAASLSTIMFNTLAPFFVPYLGVLLLLGPLELNSSHCLFSHSLGCNHGERIHERVHRSATVVGTRCRLFEKPPFIVAEGPLSVRHSSRREHDPVAACVSGMDARRGLRLHICDSAQKKVPHHSYLTQDRGPHLLAQVLRFIDGGLHVA